MQDDVEDVTDWAIAQGLADPQRICLSGASYGGYAALMGAIKTPDKYRCAIAGLPLTDIGLLLTSGWSNISSRDAPRRFWLDMVGDPATQAAELRAVSPAHLAARIKAAVMLYASEEDGQVPIEQAENMRSALRAQGQEPRWFSRVNEGHGFGGSDTRQELYRDMFDFLAQQLLLRPTPADSSPPR
jgi:dipeptidyl aminopeptidase/acylaminoacyl peptidase